MSNVTFGSEVSWPLTGDLSESLESGNFHTTKSIISEHYGVTLALLDEESEDEEIDDMFDSLRDHIGRTDMDGVPLRKTIYGD